MSRTASVAEQLFATGTGTAAAPADLGYEGILLDSSSVSQGASGRQTVTSSYADYTASVTTTGTATRVKIEV